MFVWEKLSSFERSRYADCVYYIPYERSIRVCDSPVSGTTIFSCLVNVQSKIPKSTEQLIE